MQIDAIRRRFTVGEYHRMAEVGILGCEDRVELIDGEIVRVSAMGARHAACVIRAREVFTRLLRGRAIVSPPEGSRHGAELIFGRGDTVAVAAFPDITLRVEGIPGEG